MELEQLSAVEALKAPTQLLERETVPLVRGAKAPIWHLDPSYGHGICCGAGRRVAATAGAERKRLSALEAARGDVRLCENYKCTWPSAVSGPISGMLRATEAAEACDLLAAAGEWVEADNRLRDLRGILMRMKEDAKRFAIRRDPMLVVAAWVDTLIAARAGTVAAALFELRDRFAAACASLDITTSATDWPGEVGPGRNVASVVASAGAASGLPSWLVTAVRRAWRVGFDDLRPPATILADTVAAVAALAGNEAIGVTAPGKLATGVVMSRDDLAGRVAALVETWTAAAHTLAEIDPEPLWVIASEVFLSYSPWDGSNGYWYTMAAAIYPTRTRDEIRVSLVPAAVAGRLAHLAADPDAVAVALSWAGGAWPILGTSTAGTFDEAADVFLGLWRPDDENGPYRAKAVAWAAAIAATTAGQTDPQMGPSWPV